MSATGTFTLAELQRLAAKLSSLHMVASKAKDGRQGSLKDEAKIINLVRSLGGYRVKPAPKPRWWYDVRINDTPVQIKSSVFSEADNFSSKAGILWALTNLPEEILPTKRDWPDFERALLSQRGRPGNRDLLILVFNKNTGVFMGTSLRSVAIFVSNGSNLPFQIKWSQNTKPASTSGVESYRRIVQAYQASVSKKITSHPHYLDLYPIVAKP